MPPESVIQVSIEPRQLREPVVIAAFQVRRRAGRLPPRTLGYLASEWNAELEARVDGQEFLDMTVVRPEVHWLQDDRYITWPETNIYAATPPGTDRDVLLLVGPEPNFRWQSYVDSIATYLNERGARMLITLRAFPANVPHTRPAPVTMTTAHHELESSFGLAPTSSRYQGPTDVGGALAAKADSLGWKTADLTVLQPHYYPRMPNAEATMALIGVLDRVFGSTTPIAGLRARAESQLKLLEESIEQSSETRGALEELERLYDEGYAGTGPGDEGPGALPSSDELIEQIERLLGGGSESGESD
jgi:predicted ATP-grasp superfamily ATP-dependent carboligase